MSQINRNQESAENPNRKRSFYLINTIFLCCLTIASLVFALVVFFRLRTRGTDGIRQLYTKGQIETIEENAASKARNDLLLEIQSSLESGRSTTQMLRDIFSDSIVVVSGGKYYFYPLAEDVEKNPLTSGTLSHSDGMVVYSGENPSALISRGILLSDNNGRIDWDRLADSGIEETTVRVGVLRGNRFIRDQQFERNCEKAVDKGKRISLCLEVTELPEKDALTAAFDAVREITDRYGVRELSGVQDQRQDVTAEPDAGSGAGSTEDASMEDTAPEGAVDPTLILRIQTQEELSDDGTDKDAWTKNVKLLCKMTQEKGLHPVIGASLYTSAAQIDLASLNEYDRWLIDHEETSSCPYSFMFWEYNAEGDMEGVPGKSILYARVTVLDNEQDSQ